MRAWLGLAPLCIFACTDLPNISANECGNKVFERDTEDCDTFAPAGFLCRKQNTVGECHYDCGRAPDGTRFLCPEGWGCDADELCRKPTGSFVTPAAPFHVGGADTLQAGDFDGDERGDVLSRGLSNDLGEADFQVHHFDRDGRLVDTRKFGRRVGTPWFGDLSGDQRSDIVLPLFGVGLVPGQLDRSLVPETFSPYDFAGSGVRLVSLIRGQVEGQSGIVYLTAIDGMPGLHVVDQTLRLSPRGALHGLVEALSGDPKGAQVIEGSASPCRELIHAFRDESAFYVTDMCTLDPTSGAVRWRAQAEQSRVELIPPAPLRSGPQVADLNGDGHTDVLLETSQGIYAAYGDGTQLRSAVPYALALSNPGAVMPQLEMPLAAADFSGDGVVDFVLPRRIVVSSVTPGSALPRYDVSVRNHSTPWTVAQVEDLNGNGKPDVVAASNTGSGVDFFNGTGSPVLVSTHLATSGPVTHLSTGDFDGDSLRDLVFVEQRQSAQLPDWVNIAYGSALSPPRATFLAARVRGVEHIASHDGIGLLSHIELSSMQTVKDQPQGSVTWLFGSADRVPVSIIDLLTYANDGSLENSRALSLVAGAFASGTRSDVLALATDASNRSVSFWLLRGLAGPRAPLLRLPGSLDPRLLAVEARADGSARVQVQASAADLDGDQRDETLWAMPADQGLHCGVVIAGVQLDPAPLLLTRNTLVLDTPCQDPQLAALDADHDGRPDLVLLTGARGAPDRKLIVLWNDGTGGFAEAHASVVNAPELSPQAFTSLAKTPLRTFSFAFVTLEGLFVTPLVAPRSFDAAQMIAPLRQGTGIVASDCTGDRLPDLVVADAGDLRLFTADWKR